MYTFKKTADETKPTHCHYSHCCLHALLIQSFKANMSHCVCSWSIFSLMITVQLCARRHAALLLFSPLPISKSKKGVSLSALSRLPALSMCESHLLGLIKEKTQNRTVMSCEATGQGGGRQQDGGVGVGGGVMQKPQD